MKRCLLALLMLVLTTSLAQAHFIWLVPDKDGKSAQVIFSDNLQPDDPQLLAKIGKTECFLRAENGKTSPVKWTEGKDSYRLPLGTERCLLGAACAYGVIQRGNSEPFLLNYYAGLYVTPTAKAQPPAALTEAGARPPLQLVLGKEYGGLPLRVFWQGKPLADADVVILVPGQDKPVTTKSDAKGAFEFPLASGLYGIRARHIEKKEGKHDGKDYKEVRHYATLVLPVALGGAAAPPKEDGAASKLLADARAARAQWQDFPGFTADAAVNFDGTVHKGKVVVSPEGKVRCDGLEDKEVEAWARRTLGSIVGHRIDNSVALNTPCAFLDEVKEHPQGRAIRVLNDELHSSYRIKDNQITEVNRVMKDRRFTITVLENRVNAEGKFLSVSFVVNYWDLETGALVRSEANYQGWTRLGKYDLPATVRVVTAAPQKSAGTPAQGGVAGLTAQSLTLSNHRLGK